MEPSADNFFTERPEDPQVRESASVWISDSDGAIGLPRIGIEALSEQWDRRDSQLNLCFPNGRAVILRGPLEGCNPVDADGICRTFGAGGLEFRHVEPFKTLEVSYHGEARDTTSEALARNDFSGPLVQVDVEIGLTCAAPPWVPGTMNAEAAEQFHEGFAGAFISPRYEQLCTTKAEVRAGDERWSFTGTGLRIHRQGPRDTNTGGFWGHFWPSALFPSGRGFGGLTFPERTDGHPTYNEGYVFDGKDMIPATIVDPAWLRRLDRKGSDASFTLRTADGEVRIEGEAILTSCMGPGIHPDFPLALQQCGVRYTWDGEVSYGMLERSIPGDQLES